MCGIVGIHHKSNLPVELALLKKMGDTLHHRGPDDEGSFIERNIGFFHKRLSIIDLAAGHQPMTDGHLTIAFNGEIYNYVELRQALAQKGVAFKTHSDTEVILKMYQEYGPEAIPQLNGMFAFLLYDGRRQQLIAARDHFGIKPLYFYESQDKRLFASEIKAILAHPEVKAELNREALQEYLTFQFVLGENTLFKGVRKVLPGHYLRIDLKSNQLHTIKYWEPNFKTDLNHTEEYFVYEIQRLLEDAVKIQLRSDVPLGTYLSGGIDSSIVSILAAKFLPSGLKSFTGAFKEGAAFDETKYAAIVASHCKAQMHEIYPSCQDFTDSLPKLIYHMDEPVAGPGLFPQYMVSRLASKEVKVILGGQGGDEIFGGYARYVIAYLEQALKGAIFETNEEGEHIVSLTSIVGNLSSLQQYIPMMRDFWKSGAFEDMDRRYFHLIDRSEGCLDLYAEDFKSQYDREDIFQRFQKRFNQPGTLSYFNKMTHFDLFGSLPALLQVEDRVSMAVSLESRVPLLDRRIVDLVSTMPASMKFKGAEAKYLLKKAAKNILPEAILNRKDKMGFPVPLHLWAKDGARDFIHDVLLSKQCRERGIFDVASLERLIHNERAFGRSLWGALCIELWFRQFIDN